MRVSFRDAVSSEDIYDVSGQVRLLKIDWSLLPNREEMDEDEIDLDSPKGKRKAAREVREGERVRENTDRILKALIERKTRKVRAEASREIAQRITGELKRMVSLPEGIRILARNIRKPRITTVSELCEDAGHRFYRDLTLEEIMIVSLLDRPERAYDVTSDSTYRKAWRVYYDLSTRQAGVAYYMSSDSNFSDYGGEGVRVLRIPFKREVLERFRRISDPQSTSMVDFKAYQDETGYGNTFDEISSGILENGRGAQKLVSSRVSKKKMAQKWIFFGNGMGGMVWYSLLTRLAPYLESIPRVFQDEREFKGYAILFDDHLLIYDEKGKLIEKVKTAYSFNNDFISVDEESVPLDEDERADHADDLADYAREQKEESDLLNPLVEVLGHISESALRVADERNLTPREVHVRKIRKEIGIDLSDTFKRPQSPGLAKSHIAYFEPPLGFRFPELYRAFHFVFNHLPRNLRAVIRWRMGDFPAESLFSRSETESVMGEARRKEFVHYYLGPLFEAFALPDRDQEAWDKRLGSPWDWFSDKEFPLREATGEKGMPQSVLVVDPVTLCAVFKKDDRNKYLASILESLLARVWYVLINGENTRLGARFAEIVSEEPQLFDELLTMQNIYAQTGFPELRFDSLVCLNARGGNARYFSLLFGRLYSLYILDPDRLRNFPKVIEYFAWLESQNITVSRRTAKEKTHTTAPVAAVAESVEDEAPLAVPRDPMVKWDRSMAFENARQEPFWFVYFGPADWRELGLEAYFRKNYSPKQLEGLVIKWIRRIKENYRDRGVFFVGPSILNVIKLLPLNRRKKFILEHQTEMRLLFNELLYRDDSSYEVPKRGLLDEESEIIGLFSEKELAGLIDNFVFPVRDAVIYLINNPVKRRNILSALKNNTLKSIIEFNIELVEAAEDSARIKEIVRRYGGDNIPKGERKAAKKGHGSVVPRILTKEKSRGTLYKLSPVLAVAEAVLFNNIIYRAFMGMEDLPSVFLQLGISVSDQELPKDDTGMFRGQVSKPQFFTGEFEEHRLARIVCDIYRKDQALFYMDDLLKGRLRYRIAGLLTDFELASLFELSFSHIKHLLYDSPNRFGDIRLMRNSFGDRDRLTALAQARKYYLRDRVRDIRRVHIPLSEELEARAILSMKNLQLDDGTKQDQSPDILSVMNSCKILGVSLEDSMDDVKEIYIKLAFIFHTDRDGGKRHRGVFELVGSAYNTLGRYHNITGTAAR